MTGDRGVRIARDVMQGDVNLPGKVSRPSASNLQQEQASIIRSACKSDVEAIVEIEMTSFPQVYADTGDLADCRRREIEAGYPCYEVLTTSSENSEEAEIYGFISIESYLRSYRKYRDPQTEDIIALPANCLADKQPAYSILMAAARADPALLEDEFLCEFTPFMTIYGAHDYQSSPKSAYIPASDGEEAERDLCATLWRWPMCSP